MPIIALLSDIHANDHALMAVLQEIRSMQIEHIVVCGDMVGYGANPAQCVRLIRETGCRAVLGNHDEYTVLAHRQPYFLPTTAESLINPVWAGIRHAVKSLDQEAIQWLASLPRTMEIPGAIVSHAALHDSPNWPYLLSYRDAKPSLDILERSGFAIGFFGHTHRQEWFSLAGKPEPIELADDRFQVTDQGVCAVVVGSVGQPRSGDQRAAWTVWDSDARTFEFRRTEYPVAQTAIDIQQAGLPESSARRLRGWH